jgi:type VI secretion system protein ImpJ
MPHKPVWSEGVLISQHHFQQADRYHESLLAARLRAVTHYDWGVTEIEVDTSALASNQLRIQRLEGVWPDGTHVTCGDNKDHGPPPARDLPPEFGSTTSVLDVHLGLAEPSRGGAILGRPDGPKGERRFAQTLHSVVDDNTGTSPQDIEWAEPAVRIFFGEESRHGYQTLRVAQLIRSSAGGAVVRDNHVPPALQLTASPYVRSGLHRVLTAAASRQRALVAERGQRHTGNVDFHSAAAQRFWLLHTLSGSIPVLSHLLETQRTHPEEVYLTLASLVGQLSSFAGDADLNQIPKFDYLELGDVFETLFAKVLSLLSEKVDTSYVEIELKQRAEDGMYLGSFTDPALMKRELFVAVRSSQTEAVVRDRAPAVLKVASWNEIYDVVKQARRGVRLAVEWNPSSALPVRPGVCFFRIQKEGTFWDDVQRSATMALSLPDEGEWQGTSLAVYAVDGRYLG